MKRTIIIKVAILLSFLCIQPGVCCLFNALKIVDSIVENTDGEPVFGGSLVSDSRPIIVDPDPEMDSNYQF